MKQKAISIYIAYSCLCIKKTGKNISQSFTSNKITT